MARKIEVRKLTGSKNETLVLGTRDPLIAQQYAGMLGSKSEPGYWMHVAGRLMPTGDPTDIPAVLLTPQ